MSVIHLSERRPEPKPASSQPVSAEIRQFTRFVLCSICGSPSHRAASCSKRPATDPTREA